MRNILVLFLFGFFFCTFLNAPQLLDAQTLDEELISAAVKISRDLPDNSKAAIISFKSPTEALTKYVIDELDGYILRNRRVTPVVPNQSQLQRIQNVLRFNSAGGVETASAQNIGRMLEVAYIITGSLEQNIGNEYKILFNVYDTDNAKLQSQYTALLNLRNDQHLSVLLGIIVKQGSQTSFLDGVYLGGGLGLASISTIDTYNYDDPRRDSYARISLYFISDFVINNFFAIGASIGYDFFAPYPNLLSLMAKLGGKFGLVELTGNLGFTLGLSISGLTLGGTFGIKAGNGIIFIDISAIPWGILNESASYRTDSSFRASIGYKIGVGKDRK